MCARAMMAREPTESPGARGTHLGSALMSRKGDERRPRVKKRNLARVRRGGRRPRPRRLAARVGRVNVKFESTNVPEVFPKILNVV